MLRNVLMEAEKTRGRSFYQTEPIERQSSAMLVHSLEKFVDETSTEAEENQMKITEVLFSDPGYRWGRHYSVVGKILVYRYYLFRGPEIPVRRYGLVVLKTKPP